jgi:hypothetical protein
MQIEHLVGIDGVCAWPNLTLLPDGTIIAAIFNQPCHGMWEGDLDCWASTDGGRTWQFRGRPAPHEPGTNRMNCAAGLAANGDLLVLVSGWTDRDVPSKPRPHHGVAHTQQAWICRSSDGGHTWQTTGALPDTGEEFAHVPFGDVTVANDGALCVATYVWHGEVRRYSNYFTRSYDDGFTWSEPTVLNPTGNETAILHLGDGKWLAASREEDDTSIVSYASADDGHTWQRGPLLSKPRQVTGHLMRLADGRILFSHGNRIPDEYGVEARLSGDEGATWSEPFRLANMPNGDGGYPSSVQLSDGTVVTAYYGQHPERGPYQYQMDVAIWKPHYGCA